MFRRLGPALGVLAVIGTTTVAIGDPGLPDIRPHRHFIDTGDRLVQVGPRVCDNPRLQSAFNQFHSNLHVAVTGSPGPDQSAPGLHNGQGGEVAARACSFTAP